MRAHINQSGEHRVTVFGIAMSSPSIQRRAIRANLAVVVLTMVTGGLGSEMLQLYASQVLGLRPNEIGWALLALLATTPVQFRAIGWARGRSKRQVMVIGYLGSILALVPFAVLPAIFGASRSVGYICFLVAIFVSEAVFVASWGVVWWPWMQALTSPGERGRFFGRMRFSVQLFTFGVLSLFSFVIGRRLTAGEFDVLLAALGAYLGFAAFEASRLPEPVDSSGETAVSRPRPQLGDVVRLLLRRRNVRRLLAISVLTTLATSPLLVLYLTRVVGLTAATTTRVVAVQAIASLFGVLTTGQLIDRHGHAVMLRVGAGLLAVGLPIWLFVAPASHSSPTGSTTALVVVLVALSSLATSGLGVALLTAMADVVEQEDALETFTGWEIVETWVLQGFLLLAGLVLAGTTATSNARLPLGASIDDYKVILLLGAGSAVGIYAIASALAKDPYRGPNIGGSRGKPRRLMQPPAPRSRSRSIVD